MRHIPTQQRVDARIDAMKQEIAKAIAKYLDENALTQTEASYVMKDAPSQISLVVSGKLRGFSLERLMRMYITLTGRTMIVTSIRGLTRDIVFFREGVAA